MQRYTANNPINRKDPSGLEPNRTDAKGLSELIEYIRHYEKLHPNKHPQQILDELASKVKEENWSYVYSERCGQLIDVSHFLEAGSWQLVPDHIVIGMGLVIEIWQSTAGFFFSWPGGYGSSGSGASGPYTGKDGDSRSNGTYHSGFTREDLLSNALGVDFQNRWDGRTKLSDALEGYFKSLGVLEDKTNAPDYWELPHTEAEWHEKDPWYGPTMRFLEWQVNGCPIPYPSSYDDVWWEWYYAMIGYPLGQIGYYVRHAATNFAEGLQDYLTEKVKEKLYEIYQYFKMPWL